MKPISHASFINAVKVGSGPSSNFFTDRAYKMDLDDSLLRIQELNNSKCVALVPVSNVSYLWEKKEKAEEKPKK